MYMCNWLCCMYMCNWLSCMYICNWLSCIYMCNLLSCMYMCNWLSCMYMCSWLSCLYMCYILNCMYMCNWTVMRIVNKKHWLSFIWKLTEIVCYSSCVVKNRGKLMCSGMVNSSCSNSDTLSLLYRSLKNLTTLCLFIKYFGRSCLRLLFKGEHSKT